MTVLMVGPYAPYRDGIATYTVQEVAALRSSGMQVEALSPLPSAAHHFAALGNVAGFGRLASIARTYERVIIQVFPELLFGNVLHRVERAGVWGAIAAMARAVPTELRIHELDWDLMAERSSERRAATAAMKAADRVTVHTESEQHQLAEITGLDPAKLEIIDHGEHFRPACTESRAEARESLGLDPTRHLFLSIGFLQDHKGFDRAVRALAQLDTSSNAPVQPELHIVGDVRIDHPDLLAHAAMLERLTRSTPGAHLHRGYVGDADFDRWLLAADTVVLPYREIWSSGVLERARLLERPVIAADVGGLADQRHPGVELVANDAELVDAMARACATASAVTLPVRDASDEPATRHELQQRIDRIGVDASDIDESGAIASSQNLAGLGALRRPVPEGVLPGVAHAKRVVGKATNFQTSHVIDHVNSLQEASLAAIRELERRIARLEAGTVAGADPAPTHEES